MYMAYVKSKRMGSKKRRVRKTRRIKGGLVEGNPIEEVITMLDNAKQILGSMKTNSTEPSPPSPAGASAESPGNQV